MTLTFLSIFLDIMIFLVVILLIIGISSFFYRERDSKGI